MRLRLKSLCRCLTGSEGSNCNQSNDCQHAFHQHGTEGNGKHVLLILDLLGGSTGRHQRVETGHCTAGDGDEQDREQVLSVYSKAVEGIQVTLGICNKNTKDSCHDHENQQVTVQIISGLQKGPDRNNTGNHDIDKNDDVPCASGKENGAAHTDGHCSHQHQDRNSGVDPLVQLAILQQEAKTDSLQNKEHGSHRNRTVCLNLVSSFSCIIEAEAIEGSRNDICKCCNDKDTEQPAEG